METVALTSTYTSPSGLKRPCHDAGWASIPGYHAIWVPREAGSHEAQVLTVPAHMVEYTGFGTMTEVEDPAAEHYAAAVQGWDDAYADRNDLPRVNWNDQR